ncbi:MAG TPA: CmpA/NrtA family ABC transporter substrate-binding protein [Nitrobacter sp.]|nr:CmpA/NrtA family ABC transporter substrate-binding protein [Nitrobacter sp.]
MSRVISLATARKSAPPKMRIGLLRLTDGAPVIAADEFGFFAEEGVETELCVEPSWANIADKLCYGLLDAAVIVPPLAFNIHLGVRGAAQHLVIPYGVSAAGNSVTLSNALADDVRHRSRQSGVTPAVALRSVLKDHFVTFGVVHAYSTHNLLLRYWLETAGIKVGRDVQLAVVPPARAVEVLATGQIAGFCAGAPWGEVARRAGVGVPIAGSNDIWQNAPEKAFAVRARWAEEWPQQLCGAIRAILRGAKFCDAPENAEYTSALLSRRKYVDVEPHAILADLPGAAGSGRGCVFYRGATTFPWRSQGLWWLNEMRRWDLIDPTLDLRGLVADVYRPDIYRAAVMPIGESVPAADFKVEGSHRYNWVLDGSLSPIEMLPDRFCDGALFDPDAVESRLPPTPGVVVSTP